MSPDSDSVPTPDIRLPGGWSLPPFGQAQWLAILVVAIAMWAVGALQVGIQSVLHWAGSLKPAIHFYLPRNQQGQQGKLIEELRNIDQIDTLRIIDRKETDAWLRRWLGGASPEEMADLLPITIRATIHGDHEFLIEDLRDIAERFHASLNDEEFALLRAKKRLLLARKILLAAGLLLMIGMALIITNTLRLSLLAREDEISLMRLLGADEWFVRTPYLLEGAVIGTGAGLIAALLQWPLLIALRSLGMTPPDMATLAPPMLLGGVLIGVIGAQIAIRGHR